MDINEIAIKIRNIAAGIYQRENWYSMRRRLNPHHTDEQVNLELEYLKLQQKKDFFEMKALYLENRDVLCCRTDIDENDRNIYLAIDKCVNDDLEKEFNL